MWRSTRGFPSSNFTNFHNKLLFKTAIKSCQKGWLLLRKKSIHLIVEEAMRVGSCFEFKCDNNRGMGGKEEHPICSPIWAPTEWANSFYGWISGERKISIKKSKCFQQDLWNLTHAKCSTLFSFCTLVRYHSSTDNCLHQM